MKSTLFSFSALILNLCITGDPLCQPLGNTFFQTNVPFDARIALDVDFLVVHRHGDPEVGKAIASWRDKGYPAGRMFFIGSDADRLYTTGKFDNQPHLDETELDRDGNVVECGGVRPYMIPTPGWTRFVFEQIRQGVEADAVAILPEEPLAHVFGGYGEAFKKIWQERYGSPWQPPHSSVDSYYKSSKLLCDLYFELVKVAAEYTHACAAGQGKRTTMLLPIHPLMSHATGRMTYASGRSLELAGKGLDGFVGQVWTGPIAWGMSSAEGSPMSRYDDFFESAYMMYSYFAHLVKGTSIPCYLLADPVEDDPQYTWDEYRRWYNQCLVAMLQFPWMKDFEVMPWPDRVFLPGYQMATGTPGPEDYRRALMIAFAILQDLGDLPPEPSSSSPSHGPRIGFFVADTLGWQRGGPEGSHMESLHGLTVPFLRRGIPVEMVPLERHSDIDFLNGFDVLILSYEAQKPLSPKIHQSLARWIRAGGKLIYVGSQDAYDQVDEWWSREKFNSPLEDLWEQLGIWSRGDARQVLETVKGVVSPDRKKTIPFKESETAAAYSLKGAQTLFTPDDDSLTGNNNLSIISRVGIEKGELLYCGLPATSFADSKEMGLFALDLVALVSGREGDLEMPDLYQTRRGNFLAVRSCAREHSFKGRYLDLLHPDLPVLTDPSVAPKSVGLFLDCEKKLAGREGSRILFAGPRVRQATESQTRTIVELRSPDNTPSTLRLACHGMKPFKVSAQAHLQATPLEVRQTLDSESDTLLCIVPGGFDGAVLQIDWQ